MRANRQLPASVALLLGALLGTACTVGPDYEEPELAIPDQWQARAVEGIATGEATAQTWWDLLGDPVLTSLLKRAAAANLDLEVSVARIREARSLYQVAEGEWMPEIGAEASASTQGYGDNSFLGQLGVDTVDQYSLGLGLNWELDVFGRIRRSVEAAGADIQASVENYRDVLVILLADVGINYVNAIALQKRIELATENIATQSNSLQLTQDRFDAGLTSALDVAQAESNLANTEAQIPRLEAELNTTLNRIAVLLGENPGSLHEELMGNSAIPNAPDELVVGIPANVVRQRPDIRRAERLLAAQTARVGVATADLYPQFSLAGFLGFQSANLGDLISGDSVGWNVGLPMLVNVFDGGRRRGRIEGEEARTDQLLSTYELTVLTALEEVENALVAYAKERVRRDRLARAVNASLRSVELVRTQYVSGLTNFQNVLDSERSLTNQQDRLAASEGLVIVNLITLYRALGGGWRPDEENEATQTATSQ